ncbi:MAG: hypothetical protein RL199_2353 [Pseudomonadota bacterium]|jgi:hypothetical protein
MAAACAHRTATSVADRTVHVRPVALRVSAQAQALIGLDDAQLLAAGREAADRGADPLALAAYDRLVDDFPSSPHRPLGAFEAGLLLARSGRHREARGRFARASDWFGPDTPAGLDARFRLADATYFDGDPAASAVLLQALSTHPALGEARQLEAAVKAAVCLGESDRTGEAERLLRDSIARLAELPTDLRRDAGLESRARFHLGELLRRRFEAAPVTPEDGRVEPLVQQLEAKCRLLLEAQDHYLRCIRLGHPDWATASGHRIGSLYAALHDQLVAARPPPSLSVEEQSVYRAEVASRLSVLVDKAIATWEKTLATAERVGATHDLVARARSDLARLRSARTAEELP